MRLTLAATFLGFAPILACAPSPAPFESGPEGWVAHDPDGGIAGRFDTNASFHVEWEGPASAVTLHPSGADSAFVLTEDRLERGAGKGIVEWWRQGATGFQQGFDVASADSDEVVIRQAIVGAQPVLLRGGRGVRFKREGTDLLFTGLSAWDAKGDELDARMDLDGATLLFRVEAADAAFPVTIDPTLAVADFSDPGNVLGAQLGASIAPTDDLNGDGYFDVAVGAPFYSNGESEEGAIHLYLGSAAGLPSNPSQTIEGGSVGARLGETLAFGGDSNGDGYADLIAGSPSFSNGEAGEGRVLVFFGSGTAAPSTAGWILEGAQAGAQFGSAVATATDLDGDGDSELLVGAPGWSNGQAGEGAAFAFRGQAGGPLALPFWTEEGEQAGAAFGSTLTSVGDVNADGAADVIVGAPFWDNGQTDEGGVFLYAAAAQSLSGAALTTLEGNSAGAELGGALALAGDIDQDGYGDVLLGSPGWSNGQSREGRAIVHRGSASGLLAATYWAYESNIANGVAGSAVAGGGDFNRDGWPDVMLDISGTSSGGYGAYFFNTGAGLATTATTFGGVTQNTAGPGRNYAVGPREDGGLGDVLFLGMPLYDSSNGGTDAGWVRTYDMNGGQVYDWGTSTQIAGVAGEGLGTAMEPGGDLNQDGFDDLVVGVPDRDGASGDEGGVRIYFGAAAGPATTAGWTWNGTVAAARAGHDLATGQDHDGDGWIDLGVGAPQFSNGETNEGAIQWFAGGPGGFASTPDLTVEGGLSGLNLGGVIEAIGDVQGGSESEIGAGTPLGPTNLGGVWILEGSASGPLMPATPTLVGTQATAQFGAALSGDFDYNGDGSTDLLVGAPYYDNGATTDCGRLALFAGTTAGLTTAPAWTAHEGWPNSHLGEVTVTLPDFDDDGFDEFGGAAPDYSPTGASYGRWQIWRGALAPALTSIRNNNGTGNNEALGTYMRRAGQVDSTSEHGELFVGRGGDAIYGDQFVQTSTGYSLSTSQTILDFTWAAPATPIGAGDLNGDGIDDLVIGEFTANSGAGRLHLYDGNAWDRGGGWSRPWGPSLRDDSRDTLYVPGGPIPGGEASAVFTAAHAPWGRGVVAAEAQVDEIIGPEWDGADRFVGTGIDAPTSGAEAAVPLEGLPTGPAYRVRVRVRYPPHAAPIGLSAGSWMAVGGLGDPNGPAYIAEPLPDADGDGAPDVNDCEPSNPLVGPSQAEVPDDGIDQDCNLADLVSCWTDADNDGYGGGVALYEPDGICENGGLVDTGLDCVDLAPEIHPGATEVPDDGIDQDCDGLDGTTCSFDADGDGHGGTFLVDSADGDCLDEGEAAAATDCADGDAAVHPGAAEVANDGIDQDCSGADTVGCFTDGDGDGAAGPSLISAPDGDCDDPGEFAAATDCNDGNPAIAPGAGEVPGNGVDEDCNGADTVTCRVDADEDGFGTTTTTLAADGDCTDTGESTTTTDCNDGVATIYPGAAEVVGDGFDQDCSGADSISCFIDADGDGYGAAGIVAADGDCTDSGESALGGDCAPLDPLVRPGGTEVVGDGVDQDCSGTDSVLCYLDADGDGAAGAGTYAVADGDCTDLGEFGAATDCDDLNPSLTPGGEDLPGDGIDQDCSGADATTCAVDDDGDGFGSASVIAEDGDCVDAGESLFFGDCDDLDPTAFPGAAETLGDGLDQDCDGTDGVTCWSDLDGDGYGTTVVASTDSDCADAGEAPLPGDCDDLDAASLPGGIELSDDGLDQDCSGADTVTCFSDADADGYGSATFQTPDGACEDPFEAPLGGDCEDLDPFVHPGATETVGDGFDQDCDGNDGLLCLVDADGDLFGGFQLAPSADGDCDDPLESSVGGDCDDQDSQRYPGAAEACNGLDDDCVPASDEDADVDGDGLSVCDGDCDDFAALVAPGALERCDGVDSDCDPATDEGVDGDGDGTSTCDGDCDDADATRAPELDEGCDQRDTDCDGALAPDEVDTDGDGSPTCAGDCAPADDDIGPLVAELCDGLDQDCDGLPALDEYDVDGDGFPPCAGDCAPFLPLDHPGQAERCDGRDTDCLGGPAPAENDTDSDGFRPCEGDCDDGNGAARPFAPEPAAGPDLNCDGLVGDADLDGDGFSVGEGDCDDGDPEVRPDAEEICDGADTDCDGTFEPDEQVDEDGDGAPTCADCGPLNPAISPAAAELCNGIDDDCDGYGVPGGEWDLDGDGLRPCALDCDDAEPRARWGIPEDCSDGIDNDCDGTIDQNLDADLDGVGACEGDCQDRDGSVFPGAAETCNGVDDDCDAEVDEDWDEDGDGVAPCEGDCDDAAPTVFPGAPVLCNDGLDNDCLPATQEDVDGDGDGYAACDEPSDCWEGNLLVGPEALEWCNGYDDNCDGAVDESWDADGDGFTACGLDCNDDGPAVFPGGAEQCEDGVDGNCDGFDGACPEEPWPPGAGPGDEVAGCSCDQGTAAPIGGLGLWVLPWLWRRRAAYGAQPESVTSQASISPCHGDGGGAAQAAAATASQAAGS